MLYWILGVSSVEAALHSFSTISRRNIFTRGGDILVVEVAVMGTCAGFRQEVSVARQMFPPFPLKILHSRLQGPQGFKAETSALVTNSSESVEISLTPPPYRTPGIRYGLVRG